MPPFPEPSFDYTYDPAVEIAALRDWRKNKPGRQIPARRPDRLLVATWNVANLGLQERTDADHALIAEILRWFDVVAVQETNDNLTGLREVLSKLPKKYRTVFSDAAGNNERMAFVYDATKLTVGDEIGEVAPAPAEYRHIRPIATESHYDQVAFFPGETGEEFVKSGVFDFDGAVFADLWQSRSRADFEA
ncbi:MAG TPA: hypothetical protein VGR26_12460 [Acidimicrobiales bacterium]|nr:hypothetical protein [Acidimicrobiales bacterium]